MNKENPIIVEQIRISEDNNIKETIDTKIKLKDRKSILPFRKLLESISSNGVKHKVDLTYKELK